MVAPLISLALLLLFAELASANFKRLAPVLEAWDASKRNPAPVLDGSKLLWKGGWEKLATIVWAMGTSIPLLVFATACKLFLSNKEEMGNLVLGSAVGSNIIGLSLLFGLALLSGPITFFRVRTVTSPVFLLLVTVAFAYTCLNKQLSVFEGTFLLVMLIAYGFYFRRFSSEWKYYERTVTGRSLIESAEGILPILALVCMGIGFFLLAVLVAYPFVTELDQMIGARDPFRFGVHLVAFALSLPWIIRCIFSIQESDTAKAITITSISHTCLLNLLLIPSILSLFFSGTFSVALLSIHLPALLFLTGIFVSTLLIEKETGGILTWILILSYLVYTGIGLAT